MITILLIVSRNVFNFCLDHFCHSIFLDRVVEVLQETIDNDLANVSLDGVGGGAVPPGAPTGIVVPTPGTKDVDTDWAVEASVCVGVVVTILIVFYICYKRFC